MLNLGYQKRIEATSKFPCQIIMNAQGCSVVWQPGDGTRYVCTFHLSTDLLAPAGTPGEAILGTAFIHDIGASMPFYPGGMLSLEFAREYLPSLKNYSALWAFTIIANWIYGDMVYGDDVYREMAERYGFENRLPKGE
jgi:hypothetical protein